MNRRKWLDWFTRYNDNSSDKARIKEQAMNKINSILNDHEEDPTRNLIKNVDAWVRIDRWAETWENPHQFKLFCQRVIDDILNIFL